MPKNVISIPVGTGVGKDTAGAFKVIDVLSKPDTDKFWLDQFNKTPPHDQAYQIQFKCGKTYWTLKTQVWKCMHPNDVGWRTCYKCTKTADEPCRWDQQASHPISITPTRKIEFTPGQIFGDLKLLGFAFNAKRHNYYEFECIHCGNTYFHLTPTNSEDIKAVCFCPNCRDKSSSGERVIKDYCDNHNIPYQRSFCFKDCRNERELPFDFAIFNNPEHTQLKYLIEYDGRQHYEFIPFFHGDEDGFKLQQLRDKIKTDYCNNNNITLIRIPYTEFDNIAAILDQKFPI